MWIFGHLGIGSQIAAPFSRRLPLAWIFLGTILPDLIDKPLYYAFAFATGRHGLEIGLVSCSRTFAHTALFTFALAAIAFFIKSKRFAAIAIGAATHLMLDGFQDYWLLEVMRLPGESSLRLAALYPFGSSRFGDMPTESLLEHLQQGTHPFTLIAEGVGLVLLVSTWRRRNGSPSRKSKAVR